MEEFLKRLANIISEAVRFLFPGFILVVLLRLSGYLIWDLFPPKVEQLWAWTAGFALVAGVGIYTLHRDVVHQAVEAVLTLAGLTPMGAIRAGLGLPNWRISVPFGHFVLWRYGSDFVERPTSNYLRNRWAFNHFLWMIGELLLVVTIVRFNRMPLNYCFITVGVILLLFGFFQSWTLFGGEAEIWRQLGQRNGRPRST